MKKTTEGKLKQLSTTLEIYEEYVASKYNLDMEFHEFLSLYIKKIKITKIVEQLKKGEDIDLGDKFRLILKDVLINGYMQDGKQEVNLSAINKAETEIIEYLKSV